VARHVARTRLSQWQEQRTTLPGQSKQSRAKLLADSSPTAEMPKILREN